ncbi:MAG: hypothetical protein ACYTG4_10900 [Planctomycetota bacterium]
MKTGETLDATDPSSFPAIVEVMDDQVVTLEDVVRDSMSGIVRIPFRCSFPRPTEYVLKVKNTRSLAIEHRVEQSTDYLRTIEWDKKASTVIIHCVGVNFVIPAALLNLSLECTVGEPVPELARADYLPEDMREEADRAQDAQDAMHEHYVATGRKYMVSAAVIGGLLALAFGAMSNNGGVVVALNLLVGAASGAWIIRSNTDAMAMGAIVFAVPQMVLSFFGKGMQMAMNGDAFGGGLIFILWIFQLVIGSLMVKLNVGRREQAKRSGSYRLATGVWQPSLQVCPCSTCCGAARRPRTSDSPWVS